MLVVRLQGLKYRVDRSLIDRFCTSLETWPIEKIRARHLRLVQNIYRAAIDMVPYYRESVGVKGGRPQYVRSFADIARLPIVTKDLIKSRPIGQFLNSKTASWRRFLKRTSGSTGEPVVFYLDRRYIPHMQAFYYRTYRWIGIAPHVKRICIKSPDGGKRFWDSRATSYFYFRDFLETPENFISKLVEYQPVVIESHPTYFRSIAEYLRSKNQTVSIPALVAYGEQLFHAERSYIQEAFGSTELTDFYGLNEVANLGTECSVHDGLHANVLACHIEIVGQEGNPLPSGEIGRIIVTSLINEVMPLIRYDTGDLGSWIDVQCPCGRTWPKLRIYGRRNDTIKLPGGPVIPGFFFNEIFNRYVEEIQQYQVVHDGIGRLHARIVPSPLFSEGISRSIVASIANLAGPSARCTVELVTDIPLPPNGKRKYILDNAPASHDADSRA